MSDWLKEALNFPGCEHCVFVVVHCRINNRFWSRPRAVPVHRVRQPVVKRTWVGGLGNAEVFTYERIVKLAWGDFPREGAPFCLGVRIYLHGPNDHVVKEPRLNYRAQIDWWMRHFHRRRLK